MQWLHLLSGLGLGACLADDMGLGKTIQVLSLLLIRKGRNGAATAPSLLVAPASLLANWAAEIERFAPGLNARIVHPSAMAAGEVMRLTPEHMAGLDLAITSYGSLLRMPVLAETPWCCVILDEAQAIKNPNAKQTRAAKALKARARIALTGTPVENHLGDLWSIFDFINPGLLGTAKTVQPVHQIAGRAHAQSLRPAAGTGASLHPAPDEDGQSGHRRSAGQDGDQGVLPSQPQAGGALCADSDGSGRSAAGSGWHPAQEASCWRR